MGIINVTPDSFSDGGQYLDSDAAVDHGLEMWQEGADIVDVGGESTRPGSESVDAQEESARILPVVERLAAAGVAVSVDTSKAAVAKAALGVGAEAVNDVTAMRDPEMAAVVAEYGAGLVLMHMQGEPRSMQDDPRYDDVVAEVKEFLVGRAEIAEDHGIDRARICIDPGIGFGKTVRHNLDLLAGLADLAGAGYPVLVGTSRKSFLHRLADIRDPAQRDGVTSATHVLAILGGASLLRVHNVTEALRTARIIDPVARST